MFYRRKSEDRGYFDHGWLRSYHTFSFAEYYDPQYMAFGPLRVINEDYIAGGAGFPTHGHRDMEIITYVIAGAVEHKDSTGGHGVIHPGEVQKMTAGRGIRHSEFNHYKDKETHLLQIWIVPDKNSYEPYYKQTDFVSELNHGEATLLVAPQQIAENTKALGIYQDVFLYARRFQRNEKWRIENKNNRIYWVQVVQGELQIGPEALKAGDGLAIADEAEFEVNAKAGAEILLFDMGR